ncbi:gpW family head-tail joining protein [Celerinatantimonas sp. MCCC 1A17872]|uniref:gpW family head-tail joining protein n=1 Tax=Celerinatantimonas sp. MCCC 1A17872 TaxID=3177514 RepID=UPI0038C23526
MTDQELLAQYRRAYQQLVMGLSAKVIQKDGRRVEYTPADAQLLRSEITRLEATVGQSRRRPPAGVM